MANRAYHEMLLVLAEERIAAMSQALPEAEQGWLHTDELCRRVAGDISKVNVDVFRARQQFDQLGVVESHRIVERRPLTRQLRLGTPAVTITYDREAVETSGDWSGRDIEPGLRGAPASRRRHQAAFSLYQVPVRGCRS